MTPFDFHRALDRRTALTLGGSAALGSLAAGSSPFVGTGAAQAARSARVRRQAGKLPAKEIQQTIQAEGRDTSGVLSIGISRSDIAHDRVRGSLGVTFTGSFEVDGSLTFQPLGDHLAFFNGDVPLKPAEVQPFIDALIANGLTFQALHQHFIEMNPQVWFIHFRGIGEPVGLARAVRNALRTTATPLPQKMPSKPHSPLDAKRLGKILHGDAQVGDQGVVTVIVKRRGRIVIDGVRVSPEANISTNIEFKPVGHSGGAFAAPDFAMTSSEIQPVVRRMRALGWFVRCLYNQETSESPQLYFSHMLKRGNAYAMAAELRSGLDRTRAD